MDLLSDSRCLYPVGCYRDVSREAVLYDLGIGDDRWVSIGDYGVTYALRQPEVLTQGDTTSDMETDWTRIVRRILFDFWDDYCLSKGDCALYFPDFWVDEHRGYKSLLHFRRQIAISRNNCFYKALYCGFLCNHINLYPVFYRCFLCLWTDDSNFHIRQ